MPRLAGRGYRRGDVKIHGGTLGDIPAGWELAEDMVDRAPVGAGGQYVKGQQFGGQYKPTQSKTLSESQMAAHDHNRPSVSGGNGALNGNWYSANTVNNDSPTSVAGLSEPHDHGSIDVIQPSIGVIWIRKL